jgi:hypothetical protein
MTHDELLTKMDDYVDLLESNGMSATAKVGKAFRAVVELHKPSGIFCRGCGFNEEYNEPAQLLPCPTIQAIEKVLDDN